MPLWIHALLVTGSMAAATGQILLKAGAANRSNIGEFLNIWIASGLLCYAAGTLIWIYALSKARLTLVYPYTALTFVIVYTAGAVLFNESMPWKATIGIVFILIGLLLINLR